VVFACVCSWSFASSKGLRIWQIIFLPLNVSGYKPREREMEIRWDEIKLSALSEEYKL